MTAYETVTANLGQLNRDELSAVADLVTALLADMDAIHSAEQEQDCKTTAASDSGRARSNGWYETRLVNGYGPYIYRRWREGGHLRSEYIGKATAK